MNELQFIDNFCLSSKSVVVLLDQTNDPMKLSLYVIIAQNTHKSRVFSDKTVCMHPVTTYTTTYPMDIIRSF